MAVEARQVERLRPTPWLYASSGTLIMALGLFLINFGEQRTAVIWGWLPSVVGAGVAVSASLRTAATPGLHPTARRLWRHFAIIWTLVTLGVIGDTVQAVRHPGRIDQQSHDPVTSLLYLLSLLMMVWALLRLPGRGLREHRVRFVMDAATVTVTVGVFAWYLALPSLRGSELNLRDRLPVLLLSVVGLVGALALLKLALNGFIGLDRGTLWLIAAAMSLTAAGGGLFPLLVHLRPGISGGQVGTPAVLVCLVFAADRQRRAAGVVRAGRPRREFSIVPYVAVGATDVLLLVVSPDGGIVPLVVAAAAVCLTALVVFRQVHAFAENARLLRRVDANLLELNRYQEELTERATHDALTGLPNRVLFEDQTRAALAAGHLADGRALSLALIDLDDFKAINDRLGHAVGDALLVVVAQRLRGSVRAGDVVARLGGDEFGLLLPGLRGDETADVLARITEALSRPVHALGYDLLVHASVGLCAEWPGAGPQELLRRADLAMYAAKARGKGRHAVYDELLEQHQAADAQLGAALRRALDNREFSLVYQPIVALPSGRWTGVEALVRWHGPESGAAGPDTFIPVAERTGLIVELGDWILRTALLQGVAWDERYGDEAPREIGVNVSARQLHQPGFAEDVRRALAETGFDPERLVVEVTETAVFNGGVALEALHNLVGLGVRIALDDFGTGHSSLGLLRTCPADTLKVDKSFVDGIGGRSEEGVIATAMIQITNGLHLQAVAEGVETAEQAETLHRLGYRFAQGYHFSRPLTPAQVDERLNAVLRV